MKNNPHTLYKKPTKDASPSTVNYYEMYNRCAEYQGELEVSGLITFLESLEFRSFRRSNTRPKRVAELYYLNNKHPNWKDMRYDSSVFAYPSQRNDMIYVHNVLIDGAKKLTSDCECSHYLNIIRSLSATNLRLMSELEHIKTT